MGPEGAFEWVVNSPDDIRPYAILVRDKDTADHRILGQLIAKIKGPEWDVLSKRRNREGKRLHLDDHQWNVDHKPQTFEHFAYVPGGTYKLAELKRSHAQAVEKIG